MYGSSKINADAWKAIVDQFKGFGFELQGENKLTKSQQGMYYNDEISATYKLTYENNKLSVRVEADKAMWGLHNYTDFVFSFWDSSWWSQPEQIAGQLKNKLVNTCGLRTKEDYAKQC